MSALTRERVAVASGTAATGALFAATLAQNAGLFARIPIPESVGAGRNARSIIRSIQVVSADNLDWEFWFWATKRGQSGQPDTDIFLGRHSFVAANGLQIAATGLYYYSVNALDIAYFDDDAHNDPGPGSFLNVTLVNRSAGAKTANAWFQVSFGLEPTLGS